MTCFPSQTPYIELCGQANFNAGNNHTNSTMDLEMGPLTAQFILFTSLQKLDEAKRSRSGIRLRRGLLIAVTALKAKQLLWQQQDHNCAQMKFISPVQPISTSRSQTQPLTVTTTNSFYSLPNPTTSPLRDSGQMDTDQPNSFYSSTVMKRMDLDSSDYSTSGPPCFPPSPDEFLQEEENSYQSTFNTNPSKRFRLDFMFDSPTEDPSFHAPDPTDPTIPQSCCSSCVGIS